MPKNDILLREGAITVEIGSRLAYDSFASADARRLASDIRSLYVDHMRQMSARLEDERYFLPYVRAQYLYKGRDVYRRCRMALRRWDNPDAPLAQGEVALLRALAHKDVEYRYTFDNEDDFLVASNVARLPENLHYELRNSL